MCRVLQRSLPSNRGKPQFAQFHDQPLFAMIRPCAVNMRDASWHARIPRDLERIPRKLDSMTMHHVVALAVEDSFQSPLPGPEASRWWKPVQGTTTFSHFLVKHPLLMNGEVEMQPGISQSQQVHQPHFNAAA
jgi:hypothetical protein